MNTPNNRPVALILLDGWGFSQNSAGNAIALAKTPHYDEIVNRYPLTYLAASGPAVGLPDGVAGNAETGHLNIGAGRVVKTDAAQISEAIRSGDLEKNAVLEKAFAEAAASGKPVHLIGLVSDGGVHSTSGSLYSLLRMAKRFGVNEAYVHAIVDGRDVPQRTADIYLEALEIKMADIGLGRIATICGRFFAMDSGENWERTARAYTMLVHAEGERLSDAVGAVRSSFLRGISDEFIAPIVIEREPGVPTAKIADGDTVIFFNQRADTTRQLVRSLAVPDPGNSVTAKPSIKAVCLTEYDRNFRLPVAFPPASHENDVAEVFADLGIGNYRISEPDRFVHVTRFFNGGTETPPPNEMHLQVAASSKTADREAEPEMRSFKIADAYIRALRNNDRGVFVVNIPAPGLVAETGNLERTIEAVQYVDTCLGGMIKATQDAGGVAMITSTHGNCEAMQTADGEPDRHSTTNQVPLHILGADPDLTLRRDGSLRDIAPTLLGFLGIEKPAEMTGTDLCER